MKIKFKKLSETAKQPTRGSAYAAGYDLYADCESRFYLKPHGTIPVSTGISVELPEGTAGMIFARSGLAAKEGLRPANCVGVVDADYRGPVIVALHNDTDYEKVIEPGLRIAQLVVMPFVAVEWEEAEELSETVRGAGGFGSTGK